MFNSKKKTKETSGGDDNVNLEFEKPIAYCEEEFKPFVPARIEVEPIEKGFARTLGNSLRRTLLSSIPGAAVIGVKIEGVFHEFSHIEGASTDATQLILNLKKIRFKVDGDETKTVRFENQKEGRYVAGDLEMETGVSVMNPDQSLILLTGKKTVTFELYVKKGRGKVYAENQTAFEERPDIIAVDALFSPVLKVGYEDSEVRIGQDANFERLILTVTTDGSISPKEAVYLASKINQGFFDLFSEMKDMVEKTEQFKEQIEEENLILDSPIEDLKLSPRSYNSLKKGNYTTIRKVKDLTLSDLYNIPNMGKTSVSEVVEKMRELGYEIEEG